jgi:hypothetical protein
MKKLVYSLLFVGLLAGCVDNTLEVEPLDDNFPFQLVVDGDEGGDLPDAEDFGITIQFADYLPDLELPAGTITLDYLIKEVSDDMVGVVAIDKIVYEVEIDDCVYERELAFTASPDKLSGTLTLVPDADLGTVPAEFEIVLVLPGLDDTEGGFVIEFSNLQTNANLLLGSPRTFEYSVLDNDVAGEWALTMADKDAFEQFKEVFGPLNAELESLSFEDITGKVTAVFEFGEMKFEIELVETEEVSECSEGETETEVVNKVIEIEAEYDAEDGAIEWEGSHEITDDEGLVEDELDFLIEGEYEKDGALLTLKFMKLIDEDSYEEGDELFFSEEGYSFIFEED